MNRKGLTLRQKEIIGGILFLSPWLIGIAVFFLYNIGQTIVYSFNDVIIDMAHGGYHLEWRGLDHYRHIFFVHGTFNRQLVESVIDLVWELPLIIFFSLFIAILLNRKFMGRGLVRIIFFLPVVIASPAIRGVLAAAMIVALEGVDAGMAGATGAGGFNSMAVAMMFVDFGMPIRVVFFLLDAISRLHDVIRMSGVQILIFLAALQSIPSSLYEVSQIEGATAYETFWKITMPMVSPFILINIIFTIVNNFAESTVMTSAIRLVFPMRLGEASAMIMVSTVVVSIFLFAVSALVSRKVFYQT